jgi:hypothetical protein
MRNLGIVTTLLLSGAAVGVAFLGWQSLPDIQRYLRMRAM